VATQCQASDAGAGSGGCNMSGPADPAWFALSFTPLVLALSRRRRVRPCRRAGAVANPAKEASARSAGGKS
jgi:hypothetical protein